MKSPSVIVTDIVIGPSEIVVTNPFAPRVPTEEFEEVFNEYRNPKKSLMLTGQTPAFFVLSKIKF